MRLLCEPDAFQILLAPLGELCGRQAEQKIDLVLGYLWSFRLFPSRVMSIPGRLGKYLSAIGIASITFAKELVAVFGSAWQRGHSTVGHSGGYKRLRAREGLKKITKKQRLNSRKMFLGYGSIF